MNINNAYTGTGLKCIALGTNVLLHSLLGSNARIISAWGTGSNTVEACTLLGALAIIAKIACPPARIKSLFEFHPRVNWNLCLQRKIVIRLPSILLAIFNFQKGLGNTRETLFFFVYLFFPALSFLRHLLFANTLSKLRLSWKCVLLALLFKSKPSWTTGLDNLAM